MTCKKLIAICVLALAGSASAFWVDVPAALRHEVESTCIPVNGKMLKMRLPDGKDMLLFRQPDDNSLLTAWHPWIGAVRPCEGGQMINVLTHPHFRGEKTEFCFVNGRLRFMSVGKKDYEFNPKDYATPTHTIASLWPDHTEMTAQDASQADTWSGTNRLRLFSRNPNRTALLIAEAAMVVLGIGLFAGSWWLRIPGILLGLLSIHPLLLTESRAGLVAYLVGLAALLVIRFRKGVGWRFALGLLIVLVAVGAVVPRLKVCEGISARLSTARAEMFEGKRMYMWREVPRMLASAPLGWGLWQSGPAYNSWFERPDRMHSTGDLFNDHLSRLVEGGFVLGGLYVFAWALVLIGFLAFAWRGGSPVPLAVWLTYFIACIFNPMNFWGRSFYIPLAVTAWGLWKMWKSRFLTSGKDSASPLKRTFIWSAVVTAAVMAGIAVVAWRAPEQDIPLRASWMGHRVVAGKGDAQVWVVEDGFVLDGNYFGFPGREIREFYRAHPDAEALGLVSDLGRLPEKMRTLVLAGKACEPYLGLPKGRRPVAECVVFLSPSLKYDKILQGVGSAENVHIILGEFVARLEGGCVGAPENVHVIPGAELYIPGWLDSVIIRKGQEDE